MAECLRYWTRNREAAGSDPGSDSNLTPPPLAIFLSLVSGLRVLESVCSTSGETKLIPRPRGLLGSRTLKNYPTAAGKKPSSWKTSVEIMLTSLVYLQFQGLGISV